MKDALGIVETRSLPAAIEAAASMVKVANVKIVDFNYVGSGVVAVVVAGEVAAVQAAVTARASRMESKQIVRFFMKKAPSFLRNTSVWTALCEIIQAAFPFSPPGGNPRRQLRSPRPPPQPHLSAGANRPTGRVRNVCA